MARIDPNGLYCAYLRKSRQDAALEALGQGETLARHAQALSELAVRLGVRIAATYREVVSGDTIAERPEARRLLCDVNGGLWDGVLVMDVDRLGRGDSIDQGVIMQSFLYSDTLIITPDKIYDPSEDADAEFFEIKLFFSRREYTMIKKRMQRGRLASALDGCYMGSRPVYGYDRVKRQGGRGWTLTPVPEKAEVVRAVFDWYANGMDGQAAGTQAIADRLNRMGLRTDLGNPFEAGTVRGMLKNPAYIGKVRWNQRHTVYKIVDGRRAKARPRSEEPILVEGRHPGIVPPALWQRVQAMFDARGKPPCNVGAAIANPMAGLVVCPACGRHMQRKPGAEPRGDFLRCATRRCPTASAYIAAVEAAVLEFLRRWPIAFEEAPAPGADPAPDPSAAVRRQRAALQAQLDRQYDCLEQGIYTAEEFDSRRRALLDRLAALDSAAQPSPSPRPRAPTARTALDAYRLCATAADQNALLHAVIDHIEFHKTRRCTRGSLPGDHLTLVVFPRVPADGRPQGQPDL